MPRLQEKFSNSKSSIFERLRRFQVSEALTWAQVAKRLGISVSMLMMVKGEHRNLSAKALYRLEQAELEALERKKMAKRVVEGLISDEGSAAELIKREDRNRNKAEVRVAYAGRKSRSLPDMVSLQRPSDDGCIKLREVFAQTLDTLVVLFACLPESLRTDDYISLLTPESRARLTDAALKLVIPNWRILVAGRVAARSCPPD